MKSIILKTIVLIDGVEHLLSSTDYSEAISDFEKNLEHPIDDEDIIDFIKDES